MVLSNSVIQNTVSKYSYCIYGEKLRFALLVREKNQNYSKNSVSEQLSIKTSHCLKRVLAKTQRLAKNAKLTFDVFSLIFKNPG